MSTFVDVCTDGTMLATVKHLTEDKVLRADLKLADSGDDGRLRVILYDKHLSINSSVTQRRITFTTDTGQL